MMFQPTLVFLLCLFSASLALPAGRQSYLIIDEFHDAEPLLLILENTAPPDVFVSGFNDAGDILGLERDIQIAVHEARTNSVFAVSAVLDQLSFSSPPSSQSTLLVQYDGVDSDTDEADGKLILDPEGLQGADLTAGGRADAILIQVSSDLDTTLEFTVYTDASTTSVHSVSVLAENGLHDIEIPFTDFVGTADFTNVGALETRLFATTSVDVVYSELFTTGPEDPNAGRVYMMNPLSCAPEWPAVIPEFKTSTYSTSFTTTTSPSDDDGDDDDDSSSSSSDDDSSSSSSDDDDSTSSGRLFNTFGSSISPKEADQLSALGSLGQLSSNEIRELFGSGLRSSDFSSVAGSLFRDSTTSTSSTSSSSSGTILSASIPLILALALL